MLTKYKIVPFCPYHFVQYHFVPIPFCPYHFVRTILFPTILSNTILSVYHFVHAILSVPFCSLPFCPIPFCPYTILSIPFCPYHFVPYHFVRSPKKPLANIILKMVANSKRCGPFLYL